MESNSAPENGVPEKHVTELLGDWADSAFVGRQVCHVDVGWGDARKHRQRLVMADGREVMVQLPRGAFLRAGAVLWDDGFEIGVVRRPPEEAVVFDFADNVSADGVRRALLLGYLLGNQHTPLEVTEAQLRTPLMTSAETARQTLRDLGLIGHVRLTELAERGWTNTSADHHHSHDHVDGEAHHHH